MNYDSGQIFFHFTLDSDTTPIATQKTIESKNNQIASSLLPPLPSQPKIRQNSSKHDTSYVNVTQLPPSDQFKTDNSKRIDNLVHFPVPNLEISQNENHGIEEDNERSYAYQQEIENNVDIQNYHEPVINNKYKRFNFSKLNPARPNNRNTNSSSSVAAKNLNTCEPFGLYSSANNDESSPTYLTPKDEESSNRGSTEMVIDNGFVVHDAPIQTESTKKSIKNNGQIQDTKTTQKPSTKRDSEIEEAINAMNQFLYNNIIPPDHLQPLITRLIRSEVIKATMEEDYNRASELENASNLLSTAIEWRTYESSRNQQKKTINGRYINIKRAYETETNEWKKIFNVFHDQQKENQEKLEQAHDEEMRAFEQKWSNSTNMFKYNKPSPSLLQLRKIQKNLAVAHQFEEAKRVKLAADMQQIKESEEAKKRAEQTMISEYDALVEKQNREKKCFFDRQRATELFLKNQQGRVLQPLEMQMKQLQTTINKDKPTNLKPVKYTFTSTTKTKIAASELKSTSPRIPSNFTRFKKSDETQKLPISGLDVRKIIKKKRGSSVAAKIRI